MVRAVLIGRTFPYLLMVILVLTVNISQPLVMVISALNESFSPPPLMEISAWSESMLRVI